MAPVYPVGWDGVCVYSPPHRDLPLPLSPPLPKKESEARGIGGGLAFWELRRIFYSHRKETVVSSMELLRLNNLYYAGEAHRRLYELRANDWVNKYDIIYYYTPIVYIINEMMTASARYARSYLSPLHMQLY